MECDPDVQAILSFYALNVPSVRRIEPLANAGGWSGSRLWRLSDTDGRDLCLRRWPEDHPKLDRLRMMHAVVRLVHDQLPIVACPLPTIPGPTFVEHAGHYWEISLWMPGQADFHQNPSRDRLRAAMHALARFHELAGKYKQRLGLAPTVVQRQHQWSEMELRGLPMIERSLVVPLGNELDTASRPLLKLAKGLLTSVHVVPALASTPELSLQPAIRDIHHDHVLFTGDEVTGLIDFGAMRTDTPLADIARLVGSLVGDDREARQFACDAYSESRPLSECDRRLIDVLDESGLVLSALNWLTWLYVERRDMGPTAPILRRLGEILKRLEARSVGQTFLSARLC